MATSKLQQYSQKPRVFILSDISNEPDDAESLCRYLLYANQFETEGLIACTSTWMKDKVCPQYMEKMIDAYAGAVENLNKHVHPAWQYPSAEHMRSLIRKGPETYGMSAASIEIEMSPGAQLLYDAIIAPSTQPLWVLCWGGTNTLAQALINIDDDYDPEDSKRLLSRIRVYAISDRDDTSAWIRNSFPDVFYIASIHGWAQYGLATWPGISGEQYYGFDLGGPDSGTFSPSWLKQNIQIGPLGSFYPTPTCIAEPSTPSFLYLIQNGLSVPDQPDFGSWGGRYSLTDPSAEGLNSSHYSDVVDRVRVQDRTYASNHATIWRWRPAFQNDFAARMRWSMTPDFSAANHAPVLVVNGAADLAPVRISAAPGSTVTLDASASYDPDGDTLRFKWWHYREPSATHWLVDNEIGKLRIKPLDRVGAKVAVTVGGEAAMGCVLHLILEVRDDGVPSLTSYRRVLIQVVGKQGDGGVEGIREGVKKL